MSHHRERLASALQSAVQRVIARGLADPRVSGLVSVTEVRVSPDAAEARVRVSVLPHDRERLTLEGLRHSAEWIRREAGELFEVRRMPRLTFELDESLKKQAETLAAIARARDERAPDEAVPDDAPLDAPTPDDGADPCQETPQ